MPEGYETFWDAYGEGLYLKFNGKTFPGSFRSRKDAEIYAMIHDTQQRMDRIEKALARIEKELAE